MRIKCGSVVIGENDTKLTALFPERHTVNELNSPSFKGNIWAFSDAKHCLHP